MQLGAAAFATRMMVDIDRVLQYTTDMGSEKTLS